MYRHGTFSYVNWTGSTIENVSVEHSSKSVATTDTLSLPTVADGDGQTGGVVKSTGADWWEVSFLRSGQLYTGKCHCNFSEDDEGKNVKIALQKTEWSIFYPESADCANISYE